MQYVLSGVATPPRIIDKKTACLVSVKWRQANAFLCFAFESSMSAALKQTFRWAHTDNSLTKGERMARIHWYSSGTDENIVAKSPYVQTVRRPTKMMARYHKYLFQNLGCLFFSFGILKSNWKSKVSNVDFTYYLLASIELPDLIQKRSTSYSIEVQRLWISYTMVVKDESIANEHGNPGTVCHWCQVDVWFPFIFHW